jgi:hypothetical protein
MHREAAMSQAPDQPTPDDPTEAAEPEQAAGPPPLGDDFADEHASATFADQMPGGPEGAAESESPEGYAGMDPG